MDVGFSADSKDALHRLAVQLKSSLKAWRVKPQRRRSRRLANVWLLCWLLKDLGWVLLCGPVAWPAALAAIALQAHEVLHGVETAPMGEWVLSLATLGWLCGSSVWMTSQLLFEPEIHKNRASPWYSGAIFSAHGDLYHWGVFLMQAIDITTLMGLFAFYATRLSGDANVAGQWIWAQVADQLAIRQWKAVVEDEPSSSSNGVPPAGAEPSSNEVLVFGMMTPEVYSKIFIVPWILKDLFWCHQCFIPSIICVLLVTVLVADYLWLFKKWKNLAVLLWTSGSTVWISNDLVMHEQEAWPMMLSILCFAVATCIMSAVLVARPPYDDNDIFSKEEYSTML